MKYDCNKTLDYFHELKRVCDYYDDEGCSKCPLYEKQYERCYEAETEGKIVIDKLQKWSDEHPENKESFKYKLCN